MNSIDVLRNNLKLFLAIEGEWSNVRLHAQELIQNSLKQVTGINYNYSGYELLFDTSYISDENTLNVLKIYREIASSLRYSTDINYRKKLLKIQSYTSYINPIHIENKTSNLFMSALQNCRLSQNRIICKYNERGYKTSYIQTFKYDLNKITEIIPAFRTYDSAYKNFCLFIAINKMFNAETMLLQTLRDICTNHYDVIHDESECWGGVMCAIKILDFYYLNDVLSEDSTDLIQLCLLLLNIYIKYHSKVDKLRIMECFAIRSRLNERLFKSNIFLLAISEYSQRIQTNPILTKHLCMYDLEEAKRLTPNEFVGEYGENYNYFSSQLMMYQNQGLGIVLPDNGDSFDASFNEVVMLGKSIANEINDKLEYMIKPIYENFISNYNASLTKLRKFTNSYYQRMNVGNDNKLTDFYCLSWIHQLESYTHFGLVKAKFTPVKYQLKDFVKNIQIDYNKIEGPLICETGKKYIIHDLNRTPKMFKNNENIPLIYTLLILTDNEENIKAFRCYGRDFKNWIRELSRYHYFYGIAVRPFNEELYKDPETVNLTVCFQTENDINL